MKDNMLFSHLHLNITADHVHYQVLLRLVRANILKDNHWLRCFFCCLWRLKSATSNPSTVIFCVTDQGDNLKLNKFGLHLQPPGGNFETILSSPGNPTCPLPFFRLHLKFILCQDPVTPLQVATFASMFNQILGNAFELFPFIDAGKGFRRRRSSETWRRGKSGICL